MRVILIWNPSNKKHWIWRNFYKANGVGYDFTGEKNGVTFIYSNYLHNGDNLNETFLEKAENTRRMRPKRYKHIYLGEPTDESENALWKQETMIDPFRITLDEIPDLKAIVVGLDPNVSKTKTSDEAGIVVCASGHNGHYYVLKDSSAKYSPEQWCRASIGAYKTFEANSIVAEVNNGGDLVEMAIKNVDPSVFVKKVRATRGKMLRAEPISALYEQGRVHHVGIFGLMEDQMTEYAGEGDSPDRLDALVWALTELSLHESASPSVRQL